MMRRWSRYGWWILGAGLMVLLVVMALRPQVTEIDAGEVSRGPMTITINEEGETRIRHKFLVSAPVTGRVERISLEPGDAVIGGQTVVARVRAETPPLLDARTRAEAVAARTTAEAALGQARAEVQRARSALDLAQRELARERELDKAGLTTRQAVETRETAVRTAEEALRGATFAEAAASSEIARLDARLRPDRLEAEGRLLTVTSPVSGVVLRRLRESAAVVPAGEPLVEIGDPQDLEIVSDLLSTDAVQVSVGARVLLEQWGGTETLVARVRRIEPSGFRKISALGVEEQRVNVIMDFESPAEASKRLGDGYRTEVRIVAWEDDDVVQVPTSALFRRGTNWAVFVVTGDVVRSVDVSIGQRNNQSAEVQGGLSQGDIVVIHPPDTLVDDTKIRVRER
jgi:HlyD family secretion protein